MKSIQEIKYGGFYVHQQQELEELESSVTELEEKGNKIPGSTGFVTFGGGTKRQYKPRKTQRKHKQHITIKSIDYNQSMRTPIDMSNREFILCLNEEGKVENVKVEE